MKTPSLRPFALSLALVAFLAAVPVQAGVQVSYDVIDRYASGGFSASWLHSGQYARHGSWANGARMSGKVSSRISGSLSGMLDGQVLSAFSGQVSGSLKQLAGYYPVWRSFQSAFDAAPRMVDNFKLLLGKAAGGDGALKFETKGAGTDEYTGGWFDYKLMVADNSSDPDAYKMLDSGTFFKPQHMNKGDSHAFTLWGNNWHHDWGIDRDRFQGFLEKLGYKGEIVDRGDLYTKLGLDIYAHWSHQAVPEITSVAVWLTASLVGCLTLARRSPLPLAGEAG